MFGRVGLGFMVVTMAFMLVSAPAWAQELRLDKEDSPDPVQEGELLQFTIQVRNTDDMAVTDGFTVVDKLPEDVRVIGVVTSDPAECTVDEREREVRCVFEGGLAIAGEDGDRATIRITVEPTEAGELKNEATVTPETATQDMNDENNTDETTTDVRAAQPQKNNRPNNPPIIVIDDDGNPDNDPDVNDDGDLDQDEQDVEATGDLDGESTISEFSEDGTEDEDTTGDLNDTADNDTPGAVADSSTGEASTPGAVANAGGDPDEQAPVSQEQVEEQGGEVVDEVETTGPLPETGGASLVYALPLAGCALLALTLVRRRR